MVWAIECCAQIVHPERSGIHELMELANSVKIPTRMVIELSGEATVDLGYAWGLDDAFKTVTKHFPTGIRATVLKRYRSLA